MTDRTALGDRMKRYEAVTRTYLPRRTYTIIRIDGRSFRAYTRGAQRPFDDDIADMMGSVAAGLCTGMAGARWAYGQSDEVSVLLTDFESTGTQPWFDGNIQKVASVAASIATWSFNERASEVGWHPDATFDARVFTIPDPTEVANYFIWRQRDAVRNSVASVAQSEFSHRELQGLDRNAMQERLWTERGINWNDTPAGFKRGWLTYRSTYQVLVPSSDPAYCGSGPDVAIRSRWRRVPAPSWTCDRLAPFIPRYP